MADTTYEQLVARNTELEEEKHERLQEIESLERKINQLTVRLNDIAELIEDCPSQESVRRRDAGIMADAMDWVLAQAANEENEGVMWRTKVVVPRIDELRAEAACGN